MYELQERKPASCSAGTRDRRSSLDSRKGRRASRRHDLRNASSMAPMTKRQVGGTATCQLANSEPLDMNQSREDWEEDLDNRGMERYHPTTKIAGQMAFPQHSAPHKTLLGGFFLTEFFTAKTSLRDPMRDVRKGTPCRTRPSGKSPSRTRRWRRVEALHLVYHLVLRLIPGWRGRSRVSERIIGND